MPNNFKKKVTMSDIAECLGISKNAVSLALNNKPGVSDKLRRQISNLAAELDYRGFSGNSDGRGKCVLVVVSTRIRNDNYFYSEIFWSIEHEVKRIGATLITISVSQQSEDNLEIPTFPTEFSVLGLLVIGAFSEKYIAALSEIDVHMVSVDIPYNNVSISCVSSSNISASYVATKYLIECGHKKIGFIGSIHSIQSIYERWFGYCQAMAEYNLPINEDYNIFGERDSFYSLN
ncbi:MAG: LacI family DNA-binding transcriptional regulator, partial [Oscillospiraceae bacterium]